MKIQNLHPKNYKQFVGDYQLGIPFDVSYNLPDNHPAFLIDFVIDQLDLSPLYATYGKIRSASADPRTMLKIMVYAQMKGVSGSRSIEEECGTDLAMRYLLRGKNPPDHATIARFRRDHFSKCSDTILSQMTKWLLDNEEIDTECLFIDGTKIESRAGRYTFIWRKSVTKNLERMFEKIVDHIAVCEESYGSRIVKNPEGKVRPYHLKRLKEELLCVKEREGIDFVSGRGRRKTQLQRDCERTLEFIERLKGYEEKLEKLGEKNSCSKTDCDATFMRTKDDHMGNAQLKPCYNLQHAVNSSYIIDLMLDASATDTGALIPLLEKIEEDSGLRFDKIVADAGYESEENYKYLEGKGQISFIKTSVHEVQKTRKFKNDIGRFSNMDYNKEEDCYICHEGRKLTFQSVRRRKSKSGYIAKNRVYVCESCEGCSRKGECIRSRSKTPLEDRNKAVYIASDFNRLREEDNERIQSEEGALLRMNRSIQAEGSFGMTKTVLGKDRFLCFGLEMARAESVLTAIAYNFKRLHSRIQRRCLGQHLYPLNNTG